MIYIIILFLVLLILFAVVIISDYINDKKLRNALKYNYGKPPKRRYDEYIINSIRSYWDNTESTPYGVDDFTWRDLNMDDVYMRLNNACSSIGEEYLYYILRNQRYDKKSITKIEQVIRFFEKHEDERVNVQVILSKLGKMTSNGVADFFKNPTNKNLEHFFIYPLLSFLAIFSIASIFIWGPSYILFVILVMVVNMLVYLRGKLTIEKEFTTIHYISSLIVCADKLSKMELHELSEYTDHLQKVLLPLRKIGRLANVVIGTTSSDIEALAKYFKIFFMLDFLFYRRMISTITVHVNECLELYEIIGYLDATISIASYRKSLESYTIPKFVEGNEIIIENMVHPLILKPVSNSITLNRNSIITGSNASGKSTFIKSFAINAILAQTINTCLANRFEMKPSFVITSMAINDNIEGGESYYIAEIKSLKRILDGINKDYRCLCFIDEILKGTNTIERIAASTAILDHLSYQNCLVVVATHDIELTEIVEEIYDNYHFQESINNKQIVFDYKIYKGRATTHNAIKLLEFIGYQNNIIKKANVLAQKFEHLKAWDKLRSDQERSILL